MSSSRDESIPPNISGTPGRLSSGSAGRNPPLVIVSERGRHSEAARRIVRAQAARASAAQSRETRARNREDRHSREGPQSAAEETQNPAPRSRPSPVFQDTPAHQQNRSSGQGYDDSFLAQDRHDDQARLEPLIHWVTNILYLSAVSSAGGAGPSSSTGQPELGMAIEGRFSAGSYIADSGMAMEAVEVTGSSFSRKLPVALPRGFANLQTRIQISDNFIVLLSRTACFDYASPGVENRLNELLFDIVTMTPAANVASPGQLPSHPIQSYLRLACTCLTIFQGQMAERAPFAGNQNYSRGFSAAWEEAMLFDQSALQEPKSAEAALWAIFIISVTCGSTVNVFHQLLFGLMRDLQLHYWEQVRSVLLDFIYPGSFLDEPCKRFYRSLQSAHVPPAQALS